MFKNIIKKVFITSIFASIIAGNSYVEGTFDPPNPITGTWTVDTPYTLSSSVSNEGLIDIYGSAFYGAQNALTINSGISITANSGSGDITNYGFLSNSGIIDSIGTIYNDRNPPPSTPIEDHLDGIIYNSSSGKIYSHGTIHNHREIYSEGEFKNYGTLNNYDELTNQVGNFYNHETLNNSGTIKNRGYFENRYYLTNTGTIYNHATFAGTGTINGNFVHERNPWNPSAWPSGTFAPGTATAPIGGYTINGNYTEKQILQIELESASSYDQVVVDGNVLLDSTSTLDLDFLSGYIPSIGDSFDIIFYTGTLSGTFNSFDFPAESFFDIFYDITVPDGHVVRLVALDPSTVIPEPETYLLFGSFLVVAALLKKKKAHRV